jgi:uncharacterized protein with HEPN domain
MTTRFAARIPEYLQYILDAIDRATDYVAEMDAKAFEADSRTQDAVLHNLQIIGEAVGKIRAADPQFAADHPDIAWDLIYGMRNRLVHNYFEVDLEVVWRTVKQDLPPLRLRVFAALPDSGTRP